VQEREPLPYLSDIDDHTMIGAVATTMLPLLLLLLLLLQLLGTAVAVEDPLGIFCGSMDCYDVLGIARADADAKSIKKVCTGYVCGGGGYACF
jgi:hypothetical protein